MKFLLTGIHSLKHWKINYFQIKKKKKFEIEKDTNLIWRSGGNACRVFITDKTSTFVPRLVFNFEGQKLYMENYLKPYKWTCLNEVIESSPASRQRTGNFRITNELQNHAMFLYL